MTKFEENDFLNTIQSIDPIVEDLDDAIFYALTLVPKVNEDVYFGAIGRGVFYANSRESRWFMNMDTRGVAIILAEEII